jgi:hypothetical protein
VSHVSVLDLLQVIGWAVFGAVPLGIAWLPSQNDAGRTGRAVLAFVFQLGVLIFAYVAGRRA